MAYKKLIKVSNVCQLLDKSKYPATQTINGVKFTNNGDGTITVNGTATGLCQYRITNSYKKLIGENTNKCLLVGSISADSGTPYYLQLDFIEDNSWSRAALDFGKGTIFTNSDSSLQLLSIIVKSGVTVNNIVFKPQLFDLTEMYGAGNEPTTVEQFRQDFPEEMYDYSPHCWLTSYKRVITTGEGNYLTTYQRNLTCKTKNLFDYSKVNNLMYIDGYSINQYFIKDGNKFTITYPMSKGATYLDCIIPLKAGTYTLSLFAFGTVSGATPGFFGLVKVEDDYKVKVYNKYKKIWYSSNDRQSYTMIIEEDGNYAVYAYASSGVVPVDCSFWDIQLEEGSTATGYVPYGHL